MVPLVTGPGSPRFHAAALVGAVIVLVAVPAWAGSDDRGLESGPWVASGSAAGVARVVEADFDYTWDGRIPATFTFDVIGDTAEGTWEHGGSADIVIDTVNDAGAPIRVTATDLRYAGSGTVGGTNRMLVLDGTTRTIGSMSIETAEGSFAFPADASAPTPTLQLEVVSRGCNTAVGRWAYGIQSALEAVGLTADISGTWLGMRDTEAMREEAEQLLDDLQSTGLEEPELYSQSPLLTTAAELIQKADAFMAQFPGWTMDEVFALLDEMERVLNALENVEGCDRQLLGDENLEEFAGLLVRWVQDIVLAAAHGTETPLGTADAIDLQQLTLIAARVGAIGPGSTDPRLAAQVESALIGRGEEILTAGLDAETGEIAVDDDVLRVLAVGAAMGWEYEVGGVTIDAREVYEEFSR